jgi:hypothetical protein
MSDHDLKGPEDVEVNPLSDDDLESVAGGADTNSNSANACCSSNSANSCCTGGSGNPAN